MSQIFYYNASGGKRSFRFSRKLLELLKKQELSYRPLIFLCIGSDRSTGDSLGPIIGHKLEQSFRKNFAVYGTLQTPVHALNLEETLDKIQLLYEQPFIIAIDASLGERSHIGYVTLSDMPLFPGLGVKKSLPQVGDLCITGIVNQHMPGGNLLLQSTRLGIVMEIADFISSGIVMCMHSYSSSSMTCISR